MSETPKRVLIFEDNASIQQLLAFFFKKRGYATELVGDGVDAVALARRHSPALILMDLLMPGKNGIEACADLREAGVTAPILMLTSKAFAEDRERALKAGANAYLLKPFNPAQLEAAVAALLKP
ncbi:MAG: response regulator [Elusimicrobia bacterium]|nr:response regulator [Elusimicrobiota bacterium]